MAREGMKFFSSSFHFSHDIPREPPPVFFLEWQSTFFVVFGFFSVHRFCLPSVFHWQLTFAITGMATREYVFRSLVMLICFGLLTDNACDSDRSPEYSIFVRDAALRACD